VPAGVALLGSFAELALFMRHSIRIDIATQGNPTGTQDLFGTNAFVIRAEVPVGVGVLRPQAFAVVSLPGGSQKMPFARPVDPHLEDDLRDSFVTVGECAEILNLSEERVRQLAEQGTLRSSGQLVQPALIPAYTT
jgi:hypothetical protein